MAANPNGPPNPVPNTTLSFTYTVPIVYSPEDNETYINYTEVKSLECSPVPVNDLSSLWNCTKCGNDDNYCTPVEDGDIIYHQFLVNDPLVLYYALFVYDADNNIIESSSAVNIYQIQDGLNGNNYLNVSVDVSLLNASCFYLKLYGFNCVIDEAAVSVCTADRISVYGETFSVASNYCLTNSCDSFNEYFTDMYCKSDCKDTLLIEGEYKDYDCDGVFYGLGYEQTDTVTIHKLKFRVPATIERDAYAFEETIVNNKKVKSKQLETWQFKTQKIPPYVVELLAKAFNSKTFTIDGIEYKNANKLTKNFEEGRMWIISETLQTECDEINFTCE